MLAAHDHDFVSAGSSTFTLVIPRLKAAFEVGREEGQGLRYIGMELARPRGAVHVKQKVCIYALQERDSPLTAPEVDQLRSEIVQILWVGRLSR